MTLRLVAATSLLLATALAPAVRGAGSPGLPIRDGRPVVAAVNDGTIALDELVAQLDPPVDRGRLLEGRGTAKELAVLDRLIASRLIVLEAAGMGLGDLGDIRKQVDVYSRTAMREVLLDELVKDVRPTEAAVETAYRDLVREWKTASLLFTSEAAAQKAQKAIAGRADYETVAGRAVAGNEAKAQADDSYHQKRDYLPEIAAVLEKLRVGHVSSVIRIQAGFVLVKVLDIRYPENAAARAEARRIVLDRQQKEAVQARERKWRADYVVVNQKLVDSLDFQSASLATFLQDTRVLAQIKGASPVTVADLADTIRMQVFHGGDQAAMGRRMNARKQATLDTTIGRRLLNMEALKRGIDKTSAYIDRVNAFEESLVFGAFVEKVLAPESKVREQDIKAYYDQHLKEFSSPEMVRVRSLAFTGRAAAEAAVGNLRKGADFAWLASTADGQAANDTPGLIRLDGKPVTTDSLPEGMERALAGAKAGDVRLYSSPNGGPIYVLAVQLVVGSQARPFDEVRGDIGKKLIGQKLNKSAEDYAAKLRALAKVEVYLKKAE